MTCWCAILERGEAINTYVYRKTVIINVDRDTTVSSVFEQVQRDMAATGQRGDRLEAWVVSALYPLSPSLVSDCAAQAS
jgi:hypothetical protein